VSPPSQHSCLNVPVSSQIKSFKKSFEIGNKYSAESVYGTYDTIPGICKGDGRFDGSTPFVLFGKLL
jgi:hypothetical protein